MFRRLTSLAMLSAGLLFLAPAAHAIWTDPVNITGIEIYPGDGTSARPPAAIIKISPAQGTLDRFAVRYNASGAPDRTLDAFMQAKLQNRQVRIYHHGTSYTVKVWWYEPEWWANADISAVQMMELR